MRSLLSSILFGVLLASSQTSSAAPVSFTIDLEFFPQFLSPSPLLAMGSARDAGIVTFDAPLTDPLSFVTFDQFLEFQLTVPVTRVATGEITSISFGLDTLRRGECTGTLVFSDEDQREGPPSCGFFFQGETFLVSGAFFQGSSTGPFGDPRLRFDGLNNSFSVVADFDRPAIGTFSLRPLQATPVPEPSSWIMFGVCGLLAGWGYRRC
jgi:hypothetical protein